MAYGTEYGDVRIVAENVESLSGALSISGVVSAELLSQKYPDLCLGYEAGAMVPDPDTFRLCTDEEFDTYVVSATSVKDVRDTSLIIYIPPSDTRVDNYRRNPLDSIGLTRCGPNMLTTTPSDKGINMRPGLHIDDEYEYRIGVNYGPEDRRLAVITHSARLLFPGVVSPRTPMAREHLATEPLRCLHLMLAQGAVYTAHTGGRGALIHDGSRYQLSGYSSVGFHPVPQSVH